MLTSVKTVGDYVEEQIQCPFDPAHLLRRDRFAHHVTKCRSSILKNPTSPYYSKVKNMVQCKYNSSHYVVKDKLERHHQSCDDKKVELSFFMAQESNREEPAWKKLPKSELRSQADVFGDDENWDDEPPFPAYDPRKKVMNDPNILYMPKGELTKSERRQYCQQRRLKKNGVLVDDIEVSFALPVTEKKSKNKKNKNKSQGEQEEKISVPETKDASDGGVKKEEPKLEDPPRGSAPGSYPTAPGSYPHAASGVGRGVRPPGAQALGRGILKAAPPGFRTLPPTQISSPSSVSSANLAGLKLEDDDHSWIGVGRGRGRGRGK